MKSHTTSKMKVKCVKSYIRMSGTYFDEIFVQMLIITVFHWTVHRRTKGILLFFFKGPERYNQELLSHSFICLLLPHREGIVLIRNIDLYCVTAILYGHR